VQGISWQWVFWLNVPIGLAVLATVFSAAGSYASPAAFVDGLTAATWVGAAVVGLAALSALGVPGRGRPALRRGSAPEIAAAEPVEVG
jgi:hypothetical protein